MTNLKDLERTVIIDNVDTTYFELILYKPTKPMRCFVKGQWIDCEVIQGSITKSQSKQKDYLGTSFKVIENGKVKHVRNAYHCFK